MASNVTEDEELRNRFTEFIRSREGPGITDVLNNATAKVGRWFRNDQGGADVIGVTDPDWIELIESYRTVGSLLRYYETELDFVAKKEIDVQPIRDKMWGRP